MIPSSDPNFRTRGLGVVVRLLFSYADFALGAQRSPMVHCQPSETRRRPVSADSTDT
jgi:hypothetical protein